MAQISINNMTFYYDGSSDNIFEDVSFQIDTAWKIGLIGRNGRGKTTFLKLLMDEYEYSGSINAPLSFEYFPFPVAQMERDTIAIIEEADSDYELWKVCRELNLLEVDADVLYRPFSTLSNGEQTKVLLSVLFAKENQFLLIDEPTNHLDKATRMVVMEYLKRKKGFILVSHDRQFLDGCIDHILSINKNDIEVVQGDFSSWWDNKKRQEQFERNENEKLKREIGRLTTASRQSKTWADSVESTKIGKKAQVNGESVGARAYIGEKSKRMQMRRKNLERRQEKAIAEKSQLLQNVESQEQLKIIPLKHYKQRLVIAEELSVSYESKQIFENISFVVEAEDRVVLRGKNGCGKSSVLKLILGQEINHTGRIETASGLIISYVSQDTAWLKGNLTALTKEYHLEESLFKALLRKMDFPRVQFDKPMEEYSEGQKKKVLIAKSLCEQAHLYIWDEPLNFIDVFSRIQIEELILMYCPTMLFVEHDQTFVEKIGTKIVDIATFS